MELYVANAVDSSVVSLVSLLLGSDLSDHDWCPLERSVQLDA